MEMVTVKSQSGLRWLLTFFLFALLVHLHFQLRSKDEKEQMLAKSVLAIFYSTVVGAGACAMLKQMGIQFFQ